MTLPYERTRSVIQTENFLKKLLTTPRVPKWIRDEARWCLRHYPSSCHFDMNQDRSQFSDSKCEFL